jgi:hypothetical protein
VDDPPGSGTSLATAARALTRAGVSGTRVVFLLSLFGSGEQLPGVLREWAAVIQPWDDWSVHRRLTVQPVSRALASLAGPGTEVCDVQPQGTPEPAGDRGHLRGQFAVRFLDRRSGTQARRRRQAGLPLLGPFLLLALLFESEISELIFRISRRFRLVAVIFRRD